MNCKVGQERTYTWKIKRPINENSSECNSFRSYVHDNLSRGRKMIKYLTIPDERACTIQVEFACWSCGASGPNRFRRNLLVEFPDAETEELVRQR